MYKDTERLVTAVATAARRDLDPDRQEDLLALQRGCYILNSLGIGPFYRYDMFIRGPYSSGLADD